MLLLEFLILDWRKLIHLLLKLLSLCVYAVVISLSGDSFFSIHATEDWTIFFKSIVLFLLVLANIIQVSLLRVIALN